MSAFILTCNPSLWPEGAYDHEFLPAQAEAFRRGGALEMSRWSSGSRTGGLAVGDRLYLLVQGPKGPRGVIASGWVTDPDIVEDDAWEGSEGRKNYIEDIEWDAFLSREEVLSLDELKVVAPLTNWHPQGSGIKVREDEVEALAEAWDRHLAELGLVDLTGLPGPILQGPEQVTEVTASYARALRTVRRHQSAFRTLLLASQPHECAYCGLATVKLLEAAHIIPDAHGGPSSLENGLLLCANHHRALDSGLLKWDQDGRTLLLAEDITAEDVAPLP